MFQVIKRISGALLLAVVSLHTASAAGPSPTPEIKPIAPLDTSIERVEKLTRELKIAELEKQLREAKSSTSPIPLQGQGALTPIPPINLAGGVPTMNAPKPLPEQPSVLSISTVGGISQAVSVDGKSLAVGTELVMGGAVWKVAGINPSTVVFRKCVKGKCTDTAVGVGR